MYIIIYITSNGGLSEVMAGSKHAVGAAMKHRIHDLRTRAAGNPCECREVRADAGLGAFFGPCRGRRSKSRPKRQDAASTGCEAGYGRDRSSKLWLTVSTPEAFAVPVHFGLGFDFDVAIDLRLTGQSQILFMPQSGKKRNRAQEKAELLKQPLRADVLNAFGDLHPATGTLSKAHAVDVLMNPRIKLDSLSNRHFSEIGSAFDFNLFFLSDE